MENYLLLAVTQYRYKRLSDANLRSIFGENYLRRTYAPSTNLRYCTDRIIHAPASLCNNEILRPHTPVGVVPAAHLSSVDAVIRVVRSRPDDVDDHVLRSQGGSCGTVLDRLGRLLGSLEQGEGLMFCRAVVDASRIEHSLRGPEVPGEFLDVSIICLSRMIFVKTTVI